MCPGPRWAGPDAMTALPGGRMVVGILLDGARDGAAARWLLDGARGGAVAAQVRTRPWPPAAPALDSGLR